MRSHFRQDSYLEIPAEAGIQSPQDTVGCWIPTFVGISNGVIVAVSGISEPGLFIGLIVDTCGDVGNILRHLDRDQKASFFSRLDNPEPYFFLDFNGT